MSGEKRVFKKIVALLTALLLVAGMLPTMDVTKVAAETGHVDHDGVTFTAWTNSADLPTSGSYYLDTDVAVGGTKNLTGDLNLCLNGHTVSLSGTTTGAIIEISSPCALSIYDCKPFNDDAPTGIRGANGAFQECAIYIHDAGATLNLYSGAIFKNNTTDPDPQKSNVSGAGVRMDAGTFNMFGGIICDNTASNSAGGVYLGANATFNMSGGTISNNTAVYGGGGVYVGTNATFNMSGGTISNNTAVYGGGVYVSSTGTFSMNSGTISGNTATSTGGGVYDANNMVMSGGTICNNSALSGGGVYVPYNSASNVYGRFNMSGGEIKNNSVSYNGGGVCNDNEMKMSGGKIQNNTASEDGGGVFSNGTGTIFIGGDAVIDNNSISGLANNLALANRYTDYSKQEDKKVIVGTKTGTSEGNGVPVPATGMHVGVSLKNPLVYEEYGPFYDWPIVREDGSKLSASYIFSDSPDCIVEFRDDDTVYLKHSFYSISDGRNNYYDEQSATEAMADSIFLLEEINATFDGWYTKRTGGVKVENRVPGPDYYAHWKYNGAPIITEPIYVFNDGFVIGGEKYYADELKSQYGISFDMASSTLTANGTVMMVNVEDRYPFYYNLSNEKYEELWSNFDVEVYLAAVNVLGNSASFVMEGNSYIAYCGAHIWADNDDYFSSNFGGGVYVGNGGRFILKSGTLDKNVAKGMRMFGSPMYAGYGGGVYLDSGAYAEMLGGAIQSDFLVTFDNADLGAGVYINGGAEFVMKDGTISGNLTEKRGGGVYVADDGTFKMDSVK